MPKWTLNHDRLNMHQLIYPALLQWRDSNPRLNNTGHGSVTMTTRLLQPHELNEESRREHAKQKLDGSGASEINRLYPESREKRVNRNAISENTPPAGGGQWRKKPNENETGVTSRGREWKSAGRGRKAQKRVRRAPKRSREKELLLFFSQPE
ncbi:hypothetical protein TNCV_460191 [Trichonephila clavipes]|nr:hypothetical protein TNCV_460191 [Trichonephila clavipes]